MTDIKAKALALLNEVWKERGCLPESKMRRESLSSHEALYRAIEAHEAYKQEVSDIVKAYVNGAGLGGIDEWVNLKSLIISKPKPDPLVDVLDAMKDGRAGPTTESYAACLRAALDARGLEIREKGQ